MFTSVRLKAKSVVALAAAASVVTAALGPVGVLASSHREAPMISQDPSVDATDLYAFVSPKDATKVVFAANSSPFQYADAGPNYHRFADDAVYAFHIDTNGDAKEDVTYAFDFWTKVDNGSTFLYNVKPVASLSDLNVHQYWNAYKIKGDFKGTKGQMSKANLVATGEVAAPVIGSKSVSDNEALAKKAIVNTSGKGSFFAGQRDDPFFVDLKVFDLLNLGGAVDTLKKANVNSIVMELPIKGLIGAEPIVGVWTANYRPKQMVLKGDGTVKGTDTWVQVSRLGMPLVNEVVVPLAYKDYFNASAPRKDATTPPYSAVVLKPELAGLFKAVLGLNVPTDNRKDLVTVFLTGVPGLNQPKKVQAAEMLRLNTSIAPASAPNRLGVFGGDTQGFPNGRRLSDDVTDIAIQAVAGKLVEGYTVDAALGDGVNSNDVTFSDTFPYLASPHLTK